MVQPVTGDTGTLHSVIRNRSVPGERIDMRSLEFTLKRIMIKVFRTFDSGVINSCMLFFGLPTVSELTDKRKVRFLLKCNLLASERKEKWDGSDTWRAR